MQIGFFNTKSYDRDFFTRANRRRQHDLVYLEPRLTPETMSLARGFPVICIFVNDHLDELMIRELSRHGLRMVALRSAGYNHVDVAAADRHMVHVARVPAYSPQSVAEHTIAMLLTLDRKVHRAYARVREGNFALDGLLGSEIAGQTVGVVGTGRIGARVAKIMTGFGCSLVAHDVAISPELLEIGVRYASLEELLAASDVITLHCPLTPSTFHMIDHDAIELMKNGVTLLNTSRGALVDTAAAIAGLKSGRIGALGLDTYEEEADLLFENLSDTLIKDDVFARLVTFPNVLVTGHQGFFTRQAMEAIAETTLANVTAFEEGDICTNAVTEWGRMTCNGSPEAA